MIKLPQGITGFVSDISQKKNAVSFTEFKEDMANLGQKFNVKVIACNPILTCENYFSCQIEYKNQTISILCNTVYPVIGFCTTDNPNKMPRKFLSIEEMEHHLIRLRNYAIAPPEFLHSPVEGNVIEDLSMQELSQINYRRPKEISEIIFNYWD